MSKKARAEKIRSMRWDRDVRNEREKDREKSEKNRGEKESESQ